MASSSLIIMQSIAQTCDAERLLAALFFFSRSAPGNRPTTNTWFVATLARQMCLSIPGMRERVAVVIDDDPEVLSKNTREGLIVDPLKEIPVPKVPAGVPAGRLHLVVVDGLDECDGSESQIEVLLYAAAQQLPSPLIFLIASKPEHGIRSAFSQNSLSLLARKMLLDNDYQADWDIRKYLESRFDEIKRSHPAGAKLAGDWPSKADLDYLVRKASWQFIYASVVMKWVASRHCLPTTQLDQVVKLSPLTTAGTDMPFAQLDALYMHVLSALAPDPGNLEKASEILCWMFFDDCAHALVNNISSAKTLDLADQFFSFQPGTSQVVLADLSAFLDVQSEGRPLKFFHASFPDFLVD